MVATILKTTQWSELHEHKFTSPNDSQLTKNFCFETYCQEMEKIGPSFFLWAQLRQFFKPSAYSSEP